VVSHAFRGVLGCTSSLEHCLTNTGRTSRLNEGSATF